MPHCVRVHVPAQHLPGYFAHDMAHVLPGVGFPVMLEQIDLAPVRFTDLREKQVRSEQSRFDGYFVQGDSPRGVAALLLHCEKLPYGFFIDRPAGGEFIEPPHRKRVVFMSWHGEMRRGILYS